MADMKEMSIISHQGHAGPTAVRYHPALSRNQSRQRLAEGAANLETSHTAVGMEVGPFSEGEIRACHPSPPCTPGRTGSTAPQRSVRSGIIYSHTACLSPRPLCTQENVCSGVIYNSQEVGATLLFLSDER